jgi:3-deoxy-D-arabino-heptulosonate 7-phosphate (DAHP) synthase class II
MSTDWSPQSWRSYPVKQQPIYADTAALDAITADRA